MSDKKPTELDKIKAEIAFYEEVGPLQEELESAREVKKNDPVRFADAKEAFEEKRTFYRQIGEYLKGGTDVSTIQASSEVKEVK